MIYVKYGVMITSFVLTITGCLFMTGIIEAFLYYTCCILILTLIFWSCEVVTLNRNPLVENNLFLAITLSLMVHSLYSLSFFTVLINFG